MLPLAPAAEQERGIAVAADPCGSAGVRTLSHGAIEIESPGRRAELAVIHEIEAYIHSGLDAVPSGDPRQGAGKRMHEITHQINVAAVRSELRIVLNRDGREHTRVGYLVDGSGQPDVGHEITVAPGIPVAATRPKPYRILSTVELLRVFV